MNQMEAARLLIKYGTTSLQLKSLVGLHRPWLIQMWLISNFADGGLGPH